ncbi:hypothetical protein BJ165DRAFT_1516848 [Panaeolus papilionaceus]|nr:hypothetical protein BJ165DRAFT_1516848 [Panaeolus papilionaceus]
MSETQASEIQINVKGPSELKLQITIATDKTVLELKQAISEKSDVAADRQRLIYSGRVLKDDDALNTYKIQSGHTIHMVKGVARSGGSSAGASAATPQQLPTMQTGQNVHDPLTQLNSHLGFGAMAGLNPFGEMGVNPNDPNMMQTMMNSPEFLQQMSAMMSNPAIMDQVIAMNPDLAAMGPQVRQAFQDERFRQMLSNPESLQGMLRMASAMRGAGFAPPGFGAPQSSFPAPGIPGNVSNSTSTDTASAGSNTTTSPSTGPGATTGQQPNPFSLLAGLSALGAPPASGNNTTGTGTNPPPNPFGFDPALMQQMLAFGSPFGPGAGGLGSYGAGGAAPQPADSRPPEERFQVQLQQLQDMGFSNASQNVRALLATGGNVQAAIDYIFSGGGL